MHDTDARPLPKDRRREKNLRRILDAAMGMVVDGGFEALSVNKLAAELDYTPGALYRYFPSKDALVSALVGEIIAEVGADLSRAALGDRPPLARVVACARTWRDYAERHPQRFGLVSMLLAVPRLVISSDVAGAAAVEALLAALAPPIDALGAAAKTGALTPGDALERAVLLFSGLQGVLLLKKQSARAPGLLDLDRLLASMLRTLLAGWGARPEAIAAALAKEMTA